MILVTGITGRVGGEAARSLLERGKAVRGLLRGEARAAGLAATGLEVVVGDYDQPEALARALDGVHTALMVSPNTEDQLDRERRFIDAAAAAGVSRVVKLSSSEVSPDITAPFPRAHYLSEQHLRASGVDWTMLRPDYFLQNFLMAAPGIAMGGVFHLPFGNTTVAPVDSRDVGEAAAAVLAGSGHASQAYFLSGPELMGFADIARRMGEVLGREIRYVDQDPGEFRTFMAGVLDNDWHVDALAQLFEMIKTHPVTETHPDLEQLLGRPPRTVEDFVEDHRAVFRG